ncbi:MAG TPA: hypothetical protein VHJ76_08160, partial [Actinomycetota bacterium]|nr:hypothetical protein [Actinomycetota bacterium]
MSRGAVLATAAARSMGVAGLGLLHAAAAGAVVTAGVALAAPGVVDVDGAGAAAAQAVSFGLACLRVPLESGDLRGTFAPLTGLAVTLWGLVSAATKLPPPAAEGRVGRIVSIAAAFGLACAGAAAAASGAEAAASVHGAAAAGAVWGAAASVWASVPGARASLRRFVPGAVAAAVAGSLAAAWFVAAILVRLVGLPARAIAGGVALALAVLPNAAAALLALALGGRVELALEGTALADPVTSSVSLWDWGDGRLAPPYVQLLVLVPAIAALAGARVGGAAARVDAVLLRGLRLGAVLGIAVAGAGLIGSFGAEAGGAGEVTIRLAFEPLPVFPAALAW